MLGILLFVPTIVLAVITVAYVVGKNERVRTALNKRSSAVWRGLNWVNAECELIPLSSIGQANSSSQPVDKSDHVEIVDNRDADKTPPPDELRHE
mgnify:CR=1 FL=1